MDMNKDSYRPDVSRMDIIELGRRREFTDAVRLRIVEESYSAPRLASATARKYGLSRSQLNTWRRAYREGRLAIGDFDGFVPALVVAGAALVAGYQFWFRDSSFVDIKKLTVNGVVTNTDEGRQIVSAVRLAMIGSAEALLTPRTMAFQ